MKKYKLHSKEGNYLDSFNGNKIYYCETECSELVTLKETTKSLSGIKNVYFMPGTRFPRNEFKKYYPDINIKRSFKDIDCVIFDDGTAFPEKIREIKKTNYFYQRCDEHNIVITTRFTCFADNEKNIIYLVPMGGYAGNYKYNQPEGTIPIVGYLFKPETVDKYVKILKDEIPCIHTSSVFTGFTTEVRESHITLEEAYRYYRQVQSKEITIAQSALDIVASLNPNIYLPFQSFIMSVFRNNSFVFAQDIKSKKFEIFRNFIKNKVFKFNIISKENTTIRFYGERYLNCRPWRNMDNFVSLVNHNEVFTQDMDYDTVIHCMISDMAFNINANNLVFDKVVPSISSSKIKSQIVDVIVPETKIAESNKNEYDWGI